MKKLLLFLGVFLPLSVAFSNDLIGEMTETEPFLRNYYNKYVPVEYKLVNGVPPFIEIPGDSGTSLELKIEDIIESGKKHLLSRSREHCAGKETYSKLVITFPEYLELDRVVLAPNPDSSKYYISLNKYFIENCFSKVILKGRFSDRKSKILLKNSSFGFLLVNDKGHTTSTDIFVHNLQIDYKTHPFMQGKVIEKLGENQIKVQLHETDTASAGSSGWLQERKFLTGLDTCGSSITGASAYMSLYKGETFSELLGEPKSSIEKKRFTSPHTAIESVVAERSNIIKVQYSATTAAVSKYEPQIQNLIRNASDPKVNDKVVIYCGNMTKAAMFRFENVNNYVVDNIIVNSSLRAAVQAYRNEGSGSINKFFVRKWHENSIRYVNGKSGILIGSNRGPVHLTNSYITRVFDDGVNVFSGGMSFYEGLSADPDPDSSGDSPGKYRACLGPAVDNGSHTFIREGDKLQIVALKNRSFESGKLLGHLTVSSVEGDCGTSGSYRVVGKFQGIQEIDEFLNQTDSVTAFNSSFGNAFTTYKNNIIGSNRHSAFVSKAPESKILNI